ncbi:MAG: hypothetical protein M1275_01470 [Patescibacteria group bacterium]|nr:hypothetical protein [Patescibacteria group bacterium]
MGSLEAHQDIMRLRVETAKEEYERALRKSVGSPAALKQLKSEWEARQEEYENFMEGATEKV